MSKLALGNEFGKTRRIVADVDLGLILLGMSICAAWYQGFVVVVMCPAEERLWRKAKAVGPGDKMRRRV